MDFVSYYNGQKIKKDFYFNEMTQLNMSKYFGENLTSVCTLQSIFNPQGLTQEQL